VMMQLDEVLLKDDDGKYGLVDTSELKPIEFVIDLENNNKLIQNEDDHTAHVPEGENHIYQGGVHLTGVKSGTGYTLSGASYAVNVGDYQATATLEEGYTWSDGTTAPKTIKWSIKPAEIASVELNMESYVYGENKNVSITSVKGDPVDPGQYDYSVIITNSNDMAVPAPSDAGTYTYTVIGKGNFTGSATATLTVKPDVLVSAELEQDTFEYDGKAKTVAVKSAAGLYSTPTSNDYDVVYQKDATEPGTYPVNIMGKNNFEGSVLKNINIVDNRKELDKAEPAFPEGKDENSEYTKKEAQEIELQDETGSKLDKGTYTIDIKPSDDEKMWDIRFEPVEPISKGEKLVEVKRACEHEGTGRTYQRKDESVHSVYCAKADCLKFIADEAHSFKRMEDDKNVWEECEQCHATRDVTFTVTVTYSVAKGLKTPENFLASQIKTGIKAGGSYSISSPVYKGLKASDAVVIGNIGKSNAEINVTYSECDHKDFTVTDFIKPTCTEDSKVVLATCDICGEDLVLTAEQIHALGDPYVATGHNFEEGEWRRESKQNSKPGKGHFHKCLNPGCYEREYEAHTWSGEQTYGTKCGVDFTITDECSVCGTQYEYKPTECKLVRRPDLDVAPTCTEFGFEKYECTVCHSIASDAVAPLGHDYQTIEHTDATCTEKEYTKKECTRCKDVVEEYGKYRSENGQHNYVKHWVTQLTCTEDGESDGEVCSICGQKNPDSKEEYIQHQGHKVKAWVQTFGVVRDGTTKQGTPIQLTNYRSVHECENCGATLGIEEWTVATCTKPPKLEIAAGANAEIDDISGGIHIKGNMANDGGVTFNQNVLKEVKEFVNDGKISSKYTYKKTKSNSFIIEFSEMFLADLDDGTYPVEIVNGNEYWPLMVTVENHKLVALADQEYPTGDEITKAQLDEHLAKAEAEGAVIKNLFVVPLTEEELDGITFPEPEKEEDPKDEEPREDEPTDEPEDSEGSDNGEKADDKASDDKADSKADNTASDSTAATTGAATSNPKTGSTAPIMYTALLLGAAAVITKKRR
ncbi:MAG: hypothetical protein IKR76_09505, partial [Ruminococcus sp.]|nr:hypothetical protein [Ruminococcus sp.]